MEYDAKKDNQERTVFEDKTFWYVHKKSQRIAEAVYLITQNVSKDEPLKVAVRGVAVRLVEVVTDTYSSYIKDREEGAKRIALVLTELSSLLDVAATARIVSPMNHTIVRHEVAQLVSLLLERYAAAERSDALDTSFFKDASLRVPERAQVARTDRVDRRDVSVSDTQRPVRSTFIGRTEGVTDMVATPEASADARNFIAGGRDESARKPERPQVVRQRAEGISDAAVRRVRRDTILSFIKDKGRVSIKDVASVVTDCSEKTLQRELLSLVDDGELVKVGERRWSTYELPAER